jgi:ABC-2 type transport system permease protein
MFYKAVYVIVLREFKRFFRQRGRLLVTVLRPLIWLFIVGAGFTKIIDPGPDVTYIQFLLPGMVGMTILFSSIFSTISVVWDREFGFLREMLVAPVSRFSIVAGKIMSGTSLSLFQATLLLVVAPFLGISIGPAKLAAMIVLITLVSLAITSFGLVIAARIDSLQGFNVIMNFIVLPMFFLSGALYPVQSLPEVVRYITLINPLCYGVDSFKHVLFSGGVLPPGSLFGAEFPLYADIIAISVFTVLMTLLASRTFERR